MAGHCLSGGRVAAAAAEIIWLLELLIMLRHSSGFKEKLLALLVSVGAILMNASGLYIQ